MLLRILCNLLGVVLVMGPSDGEINWDATAKVLFFGGGDDGGDDLKSFRVKLASLDQSRWDFSERAAGSGATGRPVTPPAAARASARAAASAALDWARSQDEVDGSDPARASGSAYQLGLALAPLAAWLTAGAQQQDGENTV